MLDGMSSYTLSEWEHYCSLEPFGQVRQDYLLGLLVEIFYNAHRSEDSNPLTLQEILYPEALPPPPPPDEAAAADLAFVEALVREGKVVDIRSKKGGDRP